MARIVGNRIVPDEIITEQDTWRTNMNPQKAWGNYGINTLGEAPHPGLQQFAFPNPADVSGSEYLEEDVLNMDQNLDDLGIYTHQKGEPFIAENRGNILKNLFNPEVNWRGYQRGPKDFNINDLGIMGILRNIGGPNTPEENFGRKYFNTDSSGRTYGNQAHDVFAGKNVVSAFGKGMGAAAQKRIDRIENTLRTKYNLGDDEIEDVYAGRYTGPVTSQLIQRLRNFSTDLSGYNKDLAAGTGGVDTGSRAVTNVTNPNNIGGATTSGPDMSIRGFDPGLARAMGSYNRTAGPMSGSYGPWGKAEGGRIGYANGEFVDEDINIQGPGFDVNENIEMASAVDPMDALNDMAMQIFGKPLHELTPDEKQILFDMANDQAAMGQGEGQGEGIASLV